MALGIPSSRPACFHRIRSPRSRLTKPRVSAERNNVLVSAFHVVEPLAMSASPPFFYCSFDFDENLHRRPDIFAGSPGDNLPKHILHERPKLPLKHRSRRSAMRRPRLKPILHFFLDRCHGNLRSASSCPSWSTFFMCSSSPGSGLPFFNPARWFRAHRAFRACSASFFI